MSGETYDPLKDPTSDGFVHIDPIIEKALTPSRQSWKENIYQSKLFAFLTSSALAWTLLALCLAGSYILLKMPSLAPDDAPSTMTIEPIPQVTAKAPAQKRSKVATEKIAAQATNTPVVSDMGNPISQNPKPVDLSPIDTAPIPPSPPFPPN